METATETVQDDLKRVSLDEMVLYKNPRKDLKDIKGLAASIVAARGVTQPMQGFYREIEPGVWKYLVIDGQRRFTALHMLKELGEHSELLVNIPYMVISDGLSASDITARQLISNEGEPLTPLELGEAILEMMEEDKLSISDVAAKIGKSKMYVGELKKLAELPEYIKALVRKNTLSATLLREQIKAGTLDAFIANINENGIEGEGLPSEDISADLTKEQNKTQNKITASSLNKVNSVKEFKNFAKAFSEVFTNDEAGKQKQATYEFVTGLLKNEYTYEDILAYFTDEKTAQYDTPEKQHLRAKANKGRKNAKGAAEASGIADNGTNEAAAGESAQTGGEAENGAGNAKKSNLDFLERANQFAGELSEPLPDHVEVSAPVEKGKKTAAKKAAPKKAAAKKEAAPKKARAEDPENPFSVTPKKAKETKPKTEPSKATKRKIGYDKSSGKVAE